MVEKQKCQGNEGRTRERHSFEAQMVTSQQGRDVRSAHDKVGMGGERPGTEDGTAPRLERRA